MPHSKASLFIRAPWERVAQLYRDYHRWPALFPATIRAVHLVRAEGERTELEIDHREGKVPNVMTDVSPNRIDLWEAKRRYDGSFINRFEEVAAGTRFTVEAEIRLKGMARLLAPFLTRYITRQIVRYVLLPMRQAAESHPRARPEAL